MGIFSSSESESACDEDSKKMHKHGGPFSESDEQWFGTFDPKKQDDEYIYGYVEKENYWRCEECGNLVRHKGAVLPDKEFKKVPKEDVPEANIEELEIMLDRLRYK